MAKYTLKKKTGGVSMGDDIYPIVITFKDANGDKVETTQLVSLPEKGLKEAAQAYADEFEATYKTPPKKK